jgi:hypothetical protein
MLSEITKLAFGVILALVLAFSLAGISYYFPASNKNMLSTVELVVGNASSQAGTYVVSATPNQPLWVYFGIAGLAVFAAIVVGVMLVAGRTKTKSNLGNTDK